MAQLMNAQYKLDTDTAAREMTYSGLMFAQVEDDWAVTVAEQDSDGVYVTTSYNVPLHVMAKRNRGAIYMDVDHLPMAVIGLLVRDGQLPDLGLMA
jgi:hypothetical protein